MRGVSMRLFVLVVIAAGALYPVARQPMLRALAFCAMMVVYAGAGAVWWTEHDCHYSGSPEHAWNLAVLARSPHDVTCASVEPPARSSFLITASYD
jgi:hypothetical protein